MLYNHGLHKTHQTQGESNETVDVTHLRIKLTESFFFLTRTVFFFF